MPTLDDDLKLIAEQERLLHFATFSAETAWAVGSALRTEALARKASMTFEIQIAGRTIFACTTDGAAPGQADWIRRKRNVVMRFGRSSYAVGLQLQLEGKTIEERHGLTLTDYAMHGGGVPILLTGTGIVGSVVSSGLDQRTDHGLVVKAMAQALGVAIPALP
jgi:uncharacterized protein (UPF0303 family)